MFANRFYLQLQGFIDIFSNLTIAWSVLPPKKLKGQMPPIYKVSIKFYYTLCNKIFVITLGFLLQKCRKCLPFSKHFNTINLKSIMNHLGETFSGPLAFISDHESVSALQRGFILRLFIGSNVTHV